MFSNISFVHLALLRMATVMFTGVIVRGLFTNDSTHQHTELSTSGFMENTHHRYGLAHLH